MRFVNFVFMLFLAGCASVQIAGYISRVDHPYERKIYGSFEKVTSSVMYVLKMQGWNITNEIDPAIYERDDRYDNNGYQNLLIITDVKKHFHVLSSTYTHLNVFIHSIGNTCNVEIRFESLTPTPLVKQISSARNDRLAQDILNAVEQEVRN